MSEVKLVKLVNGEDVVAKVSFVDGGNILLSNPGILMMHPQKGPTFLPWPMFSDQKQFELLRTHFIAVSNLKEDILNLYNEQLGSGLVLAKGGLNV